MKRALGQALPGLRTHRRAQGFSQQDVAARAEVSQRFVSLVEAGRNGCSPEVAARLAAALGVELAELTD
jgi:transcriptional regulator with XRE-family HTH domain